MQKQKFSAKIKALRFAGLKKRHSSLTAEGADLQDHRGTAGGREIPGQRQLPDRCKSLLH